MNLPNRIVPLIDRLKKCYSTMALCNVEPSMPRDKWGPKWEERNRWFAKAESIDTELRPLFEKWRKEKKSYTVDLQEKIQRSTNELIELLENVQRRNESLFQAMARQRDMAKNRLVHLNKSVRVIASYAACS